MAGAGSRVGGHLGVESAYYAKYLETLSHHALLPLRGAANFKASPLPPAPSQQATVDWLTVELGRFLYGKLSFCRP